MESSKSDEVEGSQNMFTRAPRGQHSAFVQVQRVTSVPPLRQTVLRIFRLGAGVSLGAYLIYKTGWRAVADALGQCDLRFIAITLPLVFAVQALGGLRIKWMLADQKCEVGYIIALKATLIGVLSGTAFFGAIGGDTARLYLFRRHLPRSSLAQLGWALIADRTAGLLALSLLVLFIDLNASPTWRASAPGHTAISGATFVACSCVVWIVFSYRTQAVRWLLSRLSGRLVEYFISSEAETLKAPNWIRAVILSFIIQLCSLGTGCLFVWSIGLSITPGEAAAIIATTTLALAFPITPLGLGIRDGSLVILFSAVGISDHPRVLALSTLLLLPPLFASALGALALLNLRRVSREVDSYRTPSSLRPEEI